MQVGSMRVKFTRIRLTRLLFLLIHFLFSITWEENLLKITSIVWRFPLFTLLFETFSVSLETMLLGVKIFVMCFASMYFFLIQFISLIILCVYSSYLHFSVIADGSFVSTFFLFFYLNYLFVFLNKKLLSCVPLD